MDWYVSSVNYAAVPVWAASTAYTVGQFVRPTAPTFLSSNVYRCTVAGTSGGTEPSWITAQSNNQTRTDGTATWTNVSGQSAYGWSAAAGTLFSLIGSAGNGTNRAVVGDTVFLASDHTETNNATNGTYRTNQGTAAFGVVRHISVNRAGSVPPVAADILPGATINHTNTSSSLFLDGYCNVYWQGITFSNSYNAGGGSHVFINNTSGTNKKHYFKDCRLWLNNAIAASRIGTNQTCCAIFDNTIVEFGHAGQGINPNTTGNLLELHWLNTLSAIGGSTSPTTLFSTPAGSSLQVICRGVDLSAITGTLMAAPTASQSTKVLLDSTKIASAVTRYATPAAGTVAHDEIELINCYDGTNVINERHGAPGSLVTDRTTYLTGGAEDDIGAYSLKLTSSSRADKSTVPLDSFWLDVGNEAIGVAKTATVEIVSSASLNKDEISLLLEYPGTSGVAGFTTTLPAVLATPTALPSSSATWVSPPATPQKQYLQATFTPQRAGRVRGLVRLGKTSTTVWVDPRITIA